MVHCEFFFECKITFIVLTNWLRMLPYEFKPSIYFLQMYASCNTE